MEIAYKERQAQELAAAAAVRRRCSRWSTSTPRDSQLLVASDQPLPQDGDHTQSSLAVGLPGPCFCL